MSTVTKNNKTNSKKDEEWLDIQGCSKIYEENHQHVCIQKAPSNYASRTFTMDHSYLEIFLARLALVARSHMAVHLSYNDVTALSFCSSTTWNWYKSCIQAVHVSWKWKTRLLFDQEAEVTSEALTFYFTHFRPFAIGTQMLLVMLVPLLRADNITCADLVWKTFIARHVYDLEKKTRHFQALQNDLIQTIPRLSITPRCMSWFLDTVAPILFPSTSDRTQAAHTLLRDAVFFDSSVVLQELMKRVQSEWCIEASDAASYLLLASQQGHLDTVQILQETYQFTLDLYKTHIIDVLFSAGHQHIIDFLVEKFGLSNDYKHELSLWLEDSPGYEPRGSNDTN